MIKERIHNLTISFIVFLLAVSALGYFFFPASMLGIVGIKSNNQVNFLVRTVGAALIALIPGAWAIRKATNSLLYQRTLLGLVIYLFLSSVIDFYAQTQGIVNNVSIPSIIFRIGLGFILLGTKPK